MMISWRRGFLFRENWRVPRSIVCGMFWIAIFILFVGMILMVISKHKGRSYVIWGGVLLGFGFCIVLLCFLLCLNAYRILAQKNKLPQTLSQQKYNLALPTSTIIHSTPAAQYPHIFVPIHPPSSKFETSQISNVPIQKRSEFEKTVSFDEAHEVHATPSRKKKVRLQNGEASTIEDTGRRDGDVVPEKATRSVPMFNSPKDLNTNKSLPSSVDEMSKMNKFEMTNENVHRSKYSRHYRSPFDGKPEYLTDDEILCKSHDKEKSSSNKAHSRTLSQSYSKRDAGNETLVEGIGSMRVKVRPIKSRLYTPDWTTGDEHLTDNDLMNVIHF